MVAKSSLVIWTRAIRPYVHRGLAFGNSGLMLQLGRLWISGLTVPHVGWTFALQDEVVQKVVHCEYIY